MHLGMAGGGLPAKIQHVLASLPRSHATNQETHDIALAYPVDAAKTIIDRVGCYGNYCMIDGANWRWQTIDQPISFLTSPGGSIITTGQAGALRILSTGTGYTGTGGKMAIQLIEGSRTLKRPPTRITATDTGSTSYAIINKAVALPHSVDWDKAEINWVASGNLSTYIAAANANVLLNLYPQDANTLIVQWGRAVAVTWTLNLQLMEYY